MLVVPLGFISSLPRLAWDKRLSCCCCWGLICGELGLRATVPAVLQYPRVLFTSRVVATARVAGSQGTLAAGLRP
jgi:hypothetical protein